MQYKFDEYKLDNGIEGVTIHFQDSKFQILADFLISDVNAFYEYIKGAFEKVILQGSDFQEFNGNVCGIEIGFDTTKVFDNLAEDGMGNWCEVDTKELYDLINNWHIEQTKFKKLHSNKN